MRLVSSRSFAIAAWAGGAVWLALLAPVLFQSFWLDETAVRWLIQGGVAELVERWRRWPYQSLSHAFLGAQAADLFGTSEAVLRLGSVLAALVGVALFWRIAKRLLPLDAAPISLLVLLGSTPLLRAASSFRPHAFGLLALLLSWLFLLRWTASVRSGDALVWSMATALVPCFHLTLVTALLAQVPLLARSLARPDRQLSLRRLGWLAAPVLLAAPLFDTVATTWRLAPLLAWSPPATFGRLLASLAPTVPFAVLILAAIFSRGRGERLASSTDPVRAELWWVAIPWWLAPIVIPFLVSWLTPVELFSPVYLLGSLPGMALFVGGVLATLSTRPIALAGAILLALSISWTAPWRQWPRTSDDPWREALTALEPPLVLDSDVVLLATHFVEASHARFDLELEPGGMLLAPVAAYPVAARVVGVSTELTPETEERLSRIWKREKLDERERFFVLRSRSSNVLRWFADHHPELRARTVGRWGALELVLLAR